MESQYTIPDMTRRGKDLILLQRMIILHNPDVSVFDVERLSLEGVLKSAKPLMQNVISVVRKGTLRSVAKGRQLPR